MRGVAPDGREDVYLLGCGQSVLDLTTEEVECINRAPVRLALNKFVAFHKVAGIVPTHVWFTEDHNDTYRILQYIFDVCERDDLENLTFVMGRHTGQVFSWRARYWAERVRRSAYYRILRRLSPRRFPAIPHWNMLMAPAAGRLGWQFERVDRTNEVFGPMVWATSIEQPLFHHRTAFTAGLNYLSVKWPKATIRLVGTDFNGYGYFFDEEAQRRGIQWHDFTSSLQAERQAHFATIPDAIQERPGTVFDVFPFMRKSIENQGGSIACNNPASATIQHGLADYAPIPTASRVVSANSVSSTR